MSRIGKRPIEIPEKTEVTLQGTTLAVKGPHGELSRNFDRDEVSISVGESEVTVTPNEESIFAQSLWGTYASHIRNMVAGVNEPFVKKLAIEGVGYRAELSGQNLILNVGFSHPVSMPIPEGVTVNVEKGAITVSGIDKELVTSFAAGIRATKTPEPYKGKGIRYENEVIRRKQGKKAT